MSQQMKQALDDFSTSKGKEVSNWTTETAFSRLEIIGKTYWDYLNGLLSFAFFSIYRNVSEIIHNSYYGVRIFIGMQQKDISAFKNSEAASEYFSNHQEKLATFILQQLNISICALLNFISQKFNFKTTTKIYEQSSKSLYDYSNEQLYALLITAV